jgi:gliding motility-associated-like protein
MRKTPTAAILVLSICSVLFYLTWFNTSTKPASESASLGWELPFFFQSDGKQEDQQAEALRRKPQKWTLCDQLRTLSDTLFEFQSGTHTGSQILTNLNYDRNQVGFITDPNQKDAAINDYILPSFLTKVMIVGDGTLAGGLGGIARLSFIVKDTFLTLHYRVVFQDPNHSLSNQPFASIKVRDRNNAPILCGDYLFVAQSGLPGFSSAGAWPNLTRFSDWRQVRLNLGRQINQRVNIEFITGDCQLRGHYGYMYVGLSCGANPKVYPKQVSNLIEGDSIISTFQKNIKVRAVDGYLWYLWSTGETQKEITLTNPGEYTLIVSDSNGCQYSDKVIFSPQNSGLEVVPKEVCQNSTINLRLLNHEKLTDKIDSIEWYSKIRDQEKSLKGKPDQIFTLFADTSFTVYTRIWTQSGAYFELENEIKVTPINTLPQKFPLRISNACVQKVAHLRTDEAYPLTDWDINGDGVFDYYSKWQIYHEFPVEGKYKVIVRILNDFGCVKDTVIHLEIPKRPKVDFISQDVCIGQQPQFVIPKSLILENKVTKIEWDYDLDDGLYFNDYEDKNLTGVVTPPLIRYFRIPKKYRISVRSTANDICADTLTKDFYVHPFHYGGLSGPKYICKHDLLVKYWLDKSSIYDTGSRVLSWQPVLSRYGMVERMDGDTVYFRCFPNNTEIILQAKISTEFGCLSDKFISSFLKETKASNPPQGPELVCLDDPIAVYSVQAQKDRIYRWQVKNGEILGRADTTQATVRWLNSGIGELSLSRSQKDSVCYRSSESLRVEVVPKKDSLLEIEAVSMNPPDGLKVSWKVEGQDKDGKLVLLRDNQSLALLDKSPTFYQDSAQSRVFYYRVGTYTPCGDTVWSLEHRNIRLSSRKVEEQDSLYLSWNSYQNWPNGVEEYQIWRALEGGDFELINRTQDTTWASTDGALAFEHCFVVLGINSEGIISRSNQSCVVFQHQPKVYEFITPNGDGKNDFFTIKKVNIFSPNQLTIFNRWGQKVYEQSDYDNTWSGLNKNAEQLEGTYFYIFNYTTLDGKNKILSGALTIVLP